jgi:hypothetical protein
MQNENSRNTIIFFVCAALIMGVYYFMVMRPQAESRRQAQIVAAEQQKAREASADAGLTPSGAAPGVFIKDRAQALGTVARVPIQTPTLKGSLSLQGARIDDLYLTRYRETLDKNSPPVELFRPQGMEHAYFAQFGWSGPNVAGGVPGPNTVWRLTKGSTLTPTTPVELTWDNGSGLRFTRVVSIDDQYMFTVKDTVANLGTQAIAIAPYGRVERQGVPVDPGQADDPARRRHRHLRRRGRLFDRTGQVQGLGQEAAHREPIDRRLAGHHRQILAGGPDPHPGRDHRGPFLGARRPGDEHPRSRHAGRHPHHPAGPPDRGDPASVRRGQARRGAEGL